MSTVMSEVADVRQSATGRIQELAQRADQLDREHAEKKRQIMDEICKLASEAKDQPSVVKPASSVEASGPAPKHQAKNGVHKANGNGPTPSKPNLKMKPSKIATGDQPRRRGRPPKNPDAPANQKPLRQVIYELLDRGPDAWRKSVKDLPADAVGLLPSHIFDIIHSEKLWLGSGANVAGQISQALSKLREEGKIVKDGKSYYIPAEE